jgi:hypothetical protein
MPGSEATAAPVSITAQPISVVEPEPMPAAASMSAWRQSIGLPVA